MNFMKLKTKLSQWDGNSFVSAAVDAVFTRFYREVET